VKLSDIRDVLIFILVTGAWVVSTIFLFQNPSPQNFMTWAGLAVTVTGTYHWMVIKDSKEKDAC
jgi:hypothetical protein